MLIIKDNINEILKETNLNVVPVAQSIEIKSILPTARPEGFRLSKFAFNAFAKFDDVEALGCGEDILSETVAREKAISEAIERVVFMKTARKEKRKMSSSGWAAHTTIADAALAAIFELIERDSALTHWLTKTPMLRIAELDFLPKEFLSGLHKSEFPNIICLASFDSAGPLITTLLQNSKGQVIAGHSSGEALERSVYSSAIEACRAAHHFQRFAYYEETKEMLSGVKPKEIAPGMHSLMYAYHEPLPSWFIGDAINLNQAREKWSLMANDVTRIVAESKFSVFKTETRFIVRAENERLQPAYWGPTETAIIEQSINWNRINKQNTNFQPHMVG